MVFTYNNIVDNSFEIGSRVIIKNTGSKLLDDSRGKILGKSFTDTEVNQWIVLLDNPLPDALAINIPGSCITAVVDTFL